MLEQVAASIDRDNDARQVVHKTLSDHIDRINTITDGIVDTAMEIFEAANPIGAKRREAIESFEDDVQKAADLLVKKKQQEDLMAKYQKRVNALQDALGSLDDPTHRATRPGGTV